MKMLTAKNGFLHYLIFKGKVTENFKILFFTEL